MLLVCFKWNEKSLCPLTHIFHSQCAYLKPSGKKDSCIWEREMSPNFFLSLDAWCVEGPAPEHSAGNPKLSSEYVSCTVHELVWYDKYRPYHSVMWFSSQQVDVGEISAKFHHLTFIIWNSSYVWDRRDFHGLLCLSLLGLPLFCPPPFYTPPSYFLRYMEGNSRLHNPSCRVGFTSNQERKKRLFHYSVYL